MSYSYIYKDRSASAKNEGAARDSTETKLKFAAKNDVRNTEEILDENIKVEKSRNQPVSVNGLVQSVSSSKPSYDIISDTCVSAGTTIKNSRNLNSNKSVHNAASAASLWFQKKSEKNKYIASNLLKKADLSQEIVHSNNSDISMDYRSVEAGRTYGFGNSLMRKPPSASIGTKLVRQCEVCKMLYTSFHACENPGDETNVLASKFVFASK